jgi:hypothetical protein
MIRQFNGDKKAYNNSLSLIDETVRFFKLHDESLIPTSLLLIASHAIKENVKRPEIRRKFKDLSAIDKISETSGLSVLTQTHFLENLMIIDDSITKDSFLNKKFKSAEVNKPKNQNNLIVSEFNTFNENKSKKDELKNIAVILRNISEDINRLANINIKIYKLI